MWLMANFIKTPSHFLQKFTKPFTLYQSELYHTMLPYLWTGNTTLLAGITFTIHDYRHGKIGNLWYKMIVLRMI